jgi:hypothetical protein
VAVLEVTQDMNPKPWQRMVLDTLRELSDASFQERVWLRCESGEMSSPSETVNQLFDDSGLVDLLERDAAFSGEADVALRRLGALADTIDFEQPIEDLLVDTRWLELRQLAAQALSEVSRVLNRG